MSIAYNFYRQSTYESVRYKCLLIGSLEIYLSANNLHVYLTTFTIVRSKSKTASSTIL